jgi:nucleoside-diphosphate-sugar epimerase
MKKNIIIFGATGGVGAYTAIYLIEKGYNVIATGKRKSDNGFFEQYGCQYLSVDIENPNDFKKLHQNDIYGIIHLAGQLPANMNVYNPKKYIDINITGTLNILDFAAKKSARKFIYSTSFSDVSYLWGSEQPIAPESNIKFPLNNDHSIYCITKNTGADLVRHYSEKYKFLHYILRFPNIYLYHPNTFYYINGEKKRKGLFNVIDQAKKGEVIELWGSPKMVRDMVYVKDCVQIIEKCLSSKCIGGTFNVGTGIGTSREEQIKGIIEVFCPSYKKSRIIYRNDMPDSPQYIMDIEKTKKELGYKPEYDYLKSLKDLKSEMEINRFEKLWGNPEDYL